MDLSFNFARRFSDAFQGASGAMRHDELRGPAESFDRNMSRVKSMVELPAHLFEVSTQNQGRWCYACCAITGQVDTPPPSDPRFREIQKLFDHLKTIPTTYEQVFPRLEVGGATMETFSAEDPNVLPGLEAILASQVISSWAAFESLAKDLWVASLNARPESLGTKLVEKGEGRAIKLEVLRQFSFDIKHRVGTIMKELYNFTSCTGSKTAYEDSFGRLLGRPWVKRIKDLFGDPLVCASAQLRHFLVHQGGIVDNKFVEMVASISLFQNVQIGNTVELDGKLTASLADVLVKRGMELLEMANHTLDKHKA